MTPLQAQLGVALYLLAFLLAGGAGVAAAGLVIPLPVDAAHEEDAPPEVPSPEALARLVHYSLLLHSSTGPILGDSAPDSSIMAKWLKTDFGLTKLPSGFRIEIGGAPDEEAELTMFVGAQRFKVWPDDPGPPPAEVPAEASP